MSKKYSIDVYMLCPIRKATENEKLFLINYKKKLEEEGLIAHYPALDTKQEDGIGGYRICMDHAEEIANSKAVHVYWTGSTGSYVDFGTSLLEHWRRSLDILLMNRENVEITVEEQERQGITKSYERVLLHLDWIANNETRINLEGLL